MPSNPRTLRTPWLCCPRRVTEMLPWFARSPTNGRAVEAKPSLICGTNTWATAMIQFRIRFDTMIARRLQPYIIALPEPRRIEPTINNQT